VRPPTRVLAAPLPDPTTMFLARPVRRGRTSTLLGLAAVLAAITLAAVLVMFDSPVQSPPQPATTSTPLPTSSSFVTPTSVPPPPTRVGPPGGKKHGGNGNGHGGD
jgi:LPXTG-site transpeptidase (sortase) family protein